VKPCSGHGRCMTVSEAAWKYDSVALHRHHEYTSWDADQMQGCVCDPGWDGFACDVQQCPVNIDIYNTGAEEHTIRTAAVHQNEVQRFSFGVASAANAVREVQRFFIAYASTVTQLPIGRFQLRIDSRYAVSVRGQGTGYTNECAFCSHDTAARGIFTSGTIHITRSGTASERAAATAKSIEEALEALRPLDDVTVSGAHETARYYGYVFLVTFTGQQVQGTMPLLQVVDLQTQNAVPLAIAERAVTGSHLTGPVVLAYDNSASIQRTNLAVMASVTTAHADCSLTYPDQFAEDTGNCLGMNSNPAKVKHMLESMSNVDTVDVHFEYGSSAGIEWVVTFRAGEYNQGDISPFTFPGVATDLTAMQDFSGLSLGSPVFLSTAVQNGRFLRPTSKFGLSIEYAGDSATFEFEATATALSMQQAIERWPLLGADTYRIGSVRVERRIPVGTPETSDNYMGELEWTVTFLDALDGITALNLFDAVVVVDRLDAAPSDAGSGGAVVNAVLDTRHDETFILRNKVDPVVEVQRVQLTAGSNPADVDEVFTLSIESSDTTFAQGFLRLQFDSSGTKCPLCKIKEVHLHSGNSGSFFQLPGWSKLLPVDFDHTNAAHLTALQSFAAESLRRSLELLPNVGVGNVQVSAVYSTGAGGIPPYSSLFSITFSGPDVGGDIADDALSALLFDGLKVKFARRVWATRYSQHHEEKILDADITVSISSVTDGTLFGGSLALTYDPHDTNANHPAVAGTSITTNNVDIGNLMTLATFDASALSSAIVAAMPQLDALDVTVTFDGGPGFVFSAAFNASNSGGVSIGVANRGTRKVMGCTPGGLTVYQGLLEGTSTPIADTPACTVQDGTDTTACPFCQKGTYLLGNWRLNVVYKGFAKKSGSLSWDATADQVQSALEGMYPDAPELLGIRVTRQDFFPHGSQFDAATFGEFQWNISLPNSRDGLLFISAEATSLAGSLFDQTPGMNGATFLQPLKLGGRQFAEIDEVQLLECHCGSAGCSGDFKLKLNDRQTASIPHSSTAAQLRTLLLAALAHTPEHSTITDIKVDILPSTATSVCESNVDVTTRIRFENWLSDLPELFVDPLDPSAMSLAASAGDIRFRVRAFEGAKGLSGFTAHDGTKQGQVCSGRGTCTTGDLKPQCSCYQDPSQSGSATLYTGHDCATRTVVPTACPASGGLPCSGHGVCSGLPSYFCSCEESYTGKACENAVCPKGHAWFDEAWDDDKAHGVAECSGIGTCSEGVCSCSSGFSGGLACEAMRCPLGDATCGGTGKCMTMAEFGVNGVDRASSNGGSSYYEGPWDSRQVTGCFCGKGLLSYVGPYEYAHVAVDGWRCSHKQCPKSADPKAVQKNSWNLIGHEVQKLTCSGAAGDGFVRLTFSNYTTAWLDADAPPNDRSRVSTQATLSVEAALNALPSIHGVVVSGNDGRLCAVAGAELFVTFRGNHDGLQLLAVESNGTLVGPTALRVTAGALSAFECSRRGVCDHSVGQCKCEKGFGSSNGNLTAGALGDCGHYDVDYNSKYITTATAHSDQVLTQARDSTYSGVPFTDASTNSVAKLLAQDAALNAANSLQALANKF